MRYTFLNPLSFTSAPRWQCEEAVRMFACGSGFSLCTPHLSACVASWLASSFTSPLMGD
jgi:hypothetical protein